MAKKDLIIEFDQFDETSVVADLETIRKINRQRFEMEQLTAVCFVDVERKVAVGYKDLGADEFWIRGHMPGFPLLPGVLMCEIAAQLCSYLAVKHAFLGADATLGFGGLNDVRFRGIVRPGQRVIVMVQLLKIRPGVLLTSRFQAYVDRNLVAEGEILGVPLPATLPGESSPKPVSGGAAGNS